MSDKIKSIHLKTRHDEEVLIDMLTLEIKTKSIENLIHIVLDKHWIIGIRTTSDINVIAMKLGHLEEVKIRNNESDFVRQYDDIREIEDGPRKIALMKSVEDKYAEYIYRSVVNILWEMGISKPSHAWDMMSLNNSCRMMASSYLEHGDPNCKTEITTHGLAIIPKKNDRNKQNSANDAKSIPFDYKTGKIKTGSDADGDDDTPNTYTILKYIPTLVEVVSKVLYEGGHKLRIYEEKERQYGEFKDDEFHHCVEEFLKYDVGVTSTLLIMIKALLHNYEIKKGPMDEESMFSRYLQLSDDPVMKENLRYLKSFARRIRFEDVKYKNGRQAKVRECMYRYIAHVIAHTLSHKKLANDIHAVMEELPPDRTIIEI